VSASWTKRKTRLALAGKLFPTHFDIDNQVKSFSDAVNRIVFEDVRFVNSQIVSPEYGLEDKAIVTAKVMLVESSNILLRRSWALGQQRRKDAELTAASSLGALADSEAQGWFDTI
jgi:Endodeoxyribonuclease RusA